ncbi:MAG: hypothetical protein KatS3mg031_0102 [Chitinophagales bacterium]|nr:MAG: hypothetical protein KatS3mg031_0102 [Chitinophagales bacterium]
MKKGVLLFLFFAGCTRHEVRENQAEYFNLVHFIHQEATRLDSLGIPVHKTVVMNGESEEKTLKIRNWRQELAPFREADINKKAYLGSYRTDTTFSASSFSVHYTALDSSLPTRTLTVHFDSVNPVRVSALIRTSNVLYTLYQQLNYVRDQGYSVQGRQQIKFMEPDSFRIQVDFLKPY